MSEIKMEKLRQVHVKPHIHVIMHIIINKEV